MILRELINQFGFDIDDAALARADKKVAGLSNRMKKLGDQSVQFGKKLSVGATLPILGLGAAMVKAASDAEETNSKFNTVFKDLQEESNQTARQLATDFGLSSTKARELLGDTGDLLTGFGFTQDSALDLSNQVNQLAVDLASFTNFSGGAEGASKALTKALLGERESIKSLGISILEEDVKRKVQENRLKGLTFASERQAKAFATLQLAQQQSQNAIGDFSRTAGSFANQFRILRARTQDAAESFGKILLPIALKLVKGLQRILIFFEKLPGPVKETILVVGGLVAALGPLLIIFGSIVNAIGVLLPLGAKLITFFKLAGNGALIAQAKLLLIPLAIAAIIAAIALIAEDIQAFLEGRDSVFGRLISGLDAAFSALGKKFQGFGDIAKAVISGILTPLRLLINAIKTGVGLIDVLRGKKSIGNFFKDAGDNLRNVLDPSRTTGSLGGALGFGGDVNPVAGLAARAQAQQAGGATQVAQSAELNVNVQGLPPEAAKEVAQASITDSLGGLLRDTARAARPAMER